MLGVEWHLSSEISGERHGRKHVKTPGTFDPEALLAAQRRNVEALTNAGKIVADGMCAYAQSQVGMMQGAMHDLWGAIQTGGRAKPARFLPPDPVGLDSASGRHDGYAER